jgi:hypothetical protein
MKCIYCEENNAIENSHIIPKFCYEWLKSTSPTKYLRDVNNPNKRLQDGFKLALLCQNCENWFSKFENSYRTHFFNKIVNYRKDMPEVLPIMKHDKLFYLSLIWRQLANYLVYDDKKYQYPDEVSFIASKAIEFKKWMEDIEKFEKEGVCSPIYIIPVESNILERLNFEPSATGVWYEYERSIAQDMRFWGEEKIDRILVYVKLPFQMVICDLNNNIRDWDIPALHNINELRLCDIKKVPDEVIQLSYYMYKTKANESYKSLTKKQQDKILKDLDKMSKSEIENTGSYKSMSRHNRSD